MVLYDRWSLITLVLKHRFHCIALTKNAFQLQVIHQIHFTFQCWLKRSTSHAHGWLLAEAHPPMYLSRYPINTLLKQNYQSFKAYAISAWGSKQSRKCLLCCRFCDTCKSDFYHTVPTLSIQYHSLYSPDSRISLSRHIPYIKSICNSGDRQTSLIIGHSMFEK